MSRKNKISRYTRKGFANSRTSSPYLFLFSYKNLHATVENLKQTSKWEEWMAVGKVGCRLVMRVVFTIVREKSILSGKWQGISKALACGNHVY